MRRGAAWRHRGRRTAGTIAAVLGLAAPHAFGAGGHHAVDDAALLDAQQCQLETWWARERGGMRTQLHVGSACRVGAVELELNLDSQRQQDNATTRVTGVQLKWARPFGSSWSAGVVLAAARQNRAPHFIGSSVVIPVTWQASETLLAHVNLGRDFVPGQADVQRAGLALEWTLPVPAWSLVAEAFRDGGANFGRAGARWAATPTLAADLSHARGLRSGSSAWWTFGLNWVWG